MNELARYELNNIMNKAENITVAFFREIDNIDPAAQLAALSPIIEGVLSVIYNSKEEVVKALSAISDDVLHNYTEANCLS